MNLHERGTRLATIITSTVGLAAVVAASALGLHDWADSEATNLASSDSSTDTAPESVTPESVPPESTAPGSVPNETVQAVQSDTASASAESSGSVTPATGTAPDVTSSGS